LAANGASGCVITACRNQLTIQTVVVTSAPMFHDQKFPSPTGFTNALPSMTWSTECSAIGHVLATASTTPSAIATR
jgi:hypothetical protein